MRIISWVFLKNHLYQFIGPIKRPTYTWAEFVSPSTLHLSPFVRILLEPLEDHGSVNQVELGLHEALVNAVRHGNSSDPNKFLRVRRILTPHWFVLQIQDEGIGIPLNARISTLPSNLDAENGRGLFLIHECFDDVRWSQRGNRVQLACKR